MYLVLDFLVEEWARFGKPRHVIEKFLKSRTFLQEGNKERVKEDEYQYRIQVTPVLLCLVNRYTNALAQMNKEKTSKRNAMLSKQMKETEEKQQMCESYLHTLM